MHFLRQIVHSLSQAVKQRLRQWTQLDNHTLVLNTVLDLTRPKSELMLEKHVVVPTATRTRSTDLPDFQRNEQLVCKHLAQYMLRGPLCALLDWNSTEKSGDCFLGRL